MNKLLHRLNQASIGVRLPLCSHRFGLVFVRSDFRGTRRDQFEPEYAANADGTFHTNLPAHQLDQLFGHYQPDAGAFDGATLLPEPIELLKKLGHFIRREAGPTVLYADAKPVWRSLATHFDRATLAIIFDGIG